MILSDIALFAQNDPEYYFEQFELEDLDFLD